MNLDIGSTVGDYQVIGILGAGGMGKVYKVKSVISDRVEAMKVLLPDLATEAELADRFLREIKVQASLEHPNIAALHTALRVDNQLLMLMEFVEGVTLEEKLRSGPIPVSDAVDSIMQVLSALDYAHARGVIHRDIKPANMMQTPSGVVKLMDFGIAKASTDRRLTMTGTTMGSLYYMSPEQIRGASELDARADLYSVGVSLYELVTGKRPFDGDSQFAIMSAHLEKTPVPPVELDARLPQMLNDVILMSVGKDPNERFQTAGAFRNALSNMAASMGWSLGRAAVPAPPAPATAPVTPAHPAANNRPNAEPPATAPAHGKRGVWVALGAVATAAVVIGLVQFGPWRAGKAAPALPAQSTTVPAAAPVEAPVVQQAPAPVETPAQQMTSPAPPTASGQAARAKAAVPQRENVPIRAARPESRPAAASGFAPAPAQQQQQAQPQQQMAAPPPQQQAQRPQPPAPAASRAELQEVREQLMMLQTRAGVVRNSLQSLQRTQAASGMNLRGDMQEAASMMGSYLEGATAALNASDPPAARSFMDKAERQIERLEKFLGR